MTRALSRSEKIGRVIRRSMTATAEAVEDHHTVGVALSGGVDSCACLASLLVVGWEPTIISYRPSTHESTDFQMARRTAENLELPFVEAVVDMEPDSLLEMARVIAGMGYGGKVQMESLVPMVHISRCAAQAGVTMMFTGDQSDGYFAVSRGASSGQGLKGELAPAMFPHKVVKDTDSRRMDATRQAYYDKDKSLSEAVRDVCALELVDCMFPFRNRDIFEAFQGSLWSEINRPRIKDPIKVAWHDYFTPDQIVTMKRQSNLHKGDSRFGDTFAEIMHEMFPGYASNRGLYGAMVRGEI